MNSVVCIMKIESLFSKDKLKESFIDTMLNNKYIIEFGYVGVAGDWWDFLIIGRKNNGRIIHLFFYKESEVNVHES